MLDVRSAQYHEVRHSLSALGLETLAAIGGLQTLPTLHANQLRLECLTHLAATACRGDQRVTAAQLADALGANGLGASQLAQMEDPPSDVFTAPVSIDRSYILFQGLNTGNAFYTQLLLDVVLTLPDDDDLRGIEQELRALLAVSQCVADRSGLRRWEVAAEFVPPEQTAHAIEVDQVASRVVFTPEELRRAGVSEADLTPFLCDLDWPESLTSDDFLDSRLLTAPLLPINGAVLLAIPSHVGPAVRYRIIEAFRAAGREDELCDRVEGEHRRVMTRALPSYGGAIRRLEGAERTRIAGTSRIEIQFDTSKKATLLMVSPRPSDISGRLLDVDLVRTPQEEQGYAAMLSDASRGTGLVFVVSCGLGGDISGMPASGTPVSLHEFYLLSLVEDCSFLQFWKMESQIERLKEAGVEFRTLYGFAALVAEFAIGDGQPVPCDLDLRGAKHTLVWVGGGGVFEQSVESQRTWDSHGVPYEPGMPAVSVSRLDANALFKSLTLRPVYAAPEGLAHGSLLGVAEVGPTPIWVQAQRPEASAEAVEINYRLWEATLNWSAGVGERIGGEWPETPPLRVFLDVRDPEIWTDFGDPDDDLGECAIESSARDSTVLLRLHPPFRRFLAQPTNDGERLLVRAICDGLLKILAPGLSAAQREQRNNEIAADLLPNNHVRHVHMFDRPDPLDMLRSSMPAVKSRLDGIDEAAWTLRLAGSAAAKPLRTSEECRDVLNRAVDRTWQRLRDRVRQYDRQSLIERSLALVETVAGQRAHFRRTSRALRSLYGDEATSVAAREEAERGLASHAAQVVLEIATCEAPAGTDAAPEQSDYDALLAGSAMLCRLGGYSDAAHRGVVREGQICANGEVRVKRGPLDRLAREYTLSTQAHFFEETDHEYESYFTVTGQRAAETDWLDGTESLRAFEAEFGATPEKLGQFVAALVDHALEENRTVIETSVEALMESATVIAGLRAESARRLLDRLTLMPRQRWNQAPDGFSDRDWYPWKYARRLSLISRPLVRVDENTSTVLFGVSSLVNTLSYLLDGIRSGALTAEYFDSTEMRSLVGSRIGALGRQFGERVATSIRALGWSADTEVPMSKLGAPAELGDIDVLAWREETRTILVVECKRLQPSYGITGIVDRLVEFRGDAIDRLGRHLRRLDWLEANQDCWSRIGLDAAKCHPVGYFVTNRPVPFQFAEALPVATDHILTEQQFVESFA